MPGAAKRKAKKARAGNTQDTSGDTDIESTQAVGTGTGRQQPGDTVAGPSQPRGLSTGPSQTAGTNRGPNPPEGAVTRPSQPGGTLTRAGVSGRGVGGSGGNSNVVAYTEPKDPSQPDPRVTKAEDDAVAGNLSLNTLTVKDGPSFPRRPGHGTVGKEIVVRANYFQVLPAKDMLFYRYEINSIQPEEKQSRRRKRIIELLLEHDVFKENNVATDWKSIIITTKRLDLGTEHQLEIRVLYYEKGLSGPRELKQGEERRDKEWPQVLLSSSMKNQPLSIDDLIKYLGSSHESSCDNKDQIVQALNIVMSRFPSTSSTVSAYGNKYFSQSQPNIPLGDNLIALCGFFTSVRTSISRLLLNVNTVAGAFYKEMKLVDCIYYYSNSTGYPYSDPRVQRFVKGLRVKLIYLQPTGGGDKTAVVFGFGLIKRGDDDVLGATSREVKFDWQEKTGGPTKRVSVEEYFRKRYNISLVYPDEPLINIGNTEHPRLVPGELCVVLPFQLSHKKLDAQQTEKMIRFAVRKPNETVDLIRREGRNVLGTDNINGPRKFNMRVSEEMLAVRGRLLPPPDLQFGTGPALKVEGGSWALLKTRSHENRPHEKFLFPIKLEKDTWTVIQLQRGKIDRLKNPKDNSRNPSTLDAVIKALRLEMENCGITVGDQRDVGPNHQTNIPDSKWEEVVDNTLKKLKERKIKLVFFILPDKGTATNILYECIKRKADVEIGIHCICALAEKIVKCEPQFMGNLALKATMKLGGMTHGLEKGQLGNVEEGHTIIMGVDVTHPSPGSRTTAPSIASCVASIDGMCGKWLGSVRAQRGTQEMVQELKDMVIERLRQWEAVHDKNPLLQKGLPTQIIVYRDGVSEGQFQLVLDQEATQIDQAISEVYPPKKPKPKVTILIVGKRHHTRFFATTQADRNKNGNVKNGLVVDRGVTSERLWDFYLQAHDGLQGTARPAHYVVIKDENKYGVNTLEKLTHNLCYLWCRATKSVSVCPPAYYADILCTRARVWMAKEYHFDDDSSTGRQAAPDLRAMKQPHADIRGSMFFI